MNKEELLHKWLNGEASEAEMLELKQDPQYSPFLKIGTASQGFTTYGFDEEGNFEKILSKKSRNASVRSFSVLWKVAAIAAVLVMSYFFLFNTQADVTTSIAEKRNFVLPDKSEVALNADSNIEYQKKNWDKNRSLSLQGEAYFKVEKGSTFTVNTTNGTVQVLGTQFNVFSRNDHFTVTCYEGLVSVAYGDTLIKLPKGNKLEILQNNVEDHSKIIVSEPSWIHNESNFEEVPLQEVLNELKRQYPISITAKDLPKSKFTGTFTHTNLDLALKAICTPLHLQYSINGTEISLYAKGDK